MADLIAAGHRYADIQHYSCAQVRIFCRAIDRREVRETLRMAAAIGIAFSGEQAAAKYLDALE